MRVRRWRASIPSNSRLNVEASGQLVRAAEAEAVNARADYGRYQRIGPSSPAWLPSEFDKRQAALDGAEARLAQAQRQFAMARDQLGYTTLIADAPGVITDLKLEVGQVVAAGQTVFSLAHTAETEIVVDVPENRLPDVRAARSVTIRLWSQPDVELKGRVREIGALAELGQPDLRSQGNGRGCAVERDWRGAGHAGSVGSERFGPRYDRRGAVRPRQRDDDCPPSRFRGGFGRRRAVGLGAGSGDASGRGTPGTGVRMVG